MDSLIAMGFDQKTAEAALKKHKGNLDFALDDLLSSTNTISSITDPSSREPPPAHAYQNSGNSTASDEIVVSEVSQFSFNEIGSSACTPIAATFASLFLKALEHNNSSRDGLNTEALLSEATFSGIASYSSINLDSHMKAHMNVEEYLLQVPELSAELKLIDGPTQALLTEPNAFRNLFVRMNNTALSRFSSLNTDNVSASNNSNTTIDISSSTITNAIQNSNICHYLAVLITKPPETVAVFLPIIADLHNPNSSNNSNGNNEKFYFFDSHSRPELGIHGSYLVTSHSFLSIIDRITTLFPPLQSSAEDENFMTMMYNSFEASAFILSNYNENKTLIEDNTTSSSAVGKTDYISKDEEDSNNNSSGTSDNNTESGYVMV